MKILYTNFHSASGGGHVTYILALARGLAAEHDVTIASPLGSDLYEQAQSIPGVRRAAVDFKPRINGFATQLLALRRLIVRGRFDVIHVNGSADHRQVMIATRLMARPPAIIFTKHNDTPVTSIGNRVRAWVGTTHTIAVSDFVATLLSRSSYRRVTVIKHGVDTQRACQPALGEALRQRRIAYLGPEGAQRIVLGSVAGTGSHKGWFDLIDALASLARADRERFAVLLAGDPPSSEQRQYVEQRGLRDQVCFTGLLTDSSEVLGCSDVGFVLSYRETLSYACREKMAAGLPVVVTRTGGLTENIDDGINGWIVPPAQPNAIARVLMSILDNPAAVSAMGRAAREKSVRDFGMESFLVSTLAVYRRAADKRASGPRHDSAHDGGLHLPGAALNRQPPAAP